MELSKQERELFLPLPVLWSKNFFNKNFLISTQEFKIDFQNRKRNYIKRKRNYLSHFWASDQKTSFTTFSPYLPRNSKLIDKTVNGIIQTGNGIISPLSRLLIKIFILQNVSYFQENGMIQPGYGITSPPSWPLIQIFLTLTYSQTFSMDLFWPICTYSDISGPNRISSQPVQDPACYYSKATILSVPSIPATTWPSTQQLLMSAHPPPC